MQIDYVKQSNNTRPSYVQSIRHIKAQKSTSGLRINKISYFIKAKDSIHRNALANEFTNQISCYKLV